MSYHDKIMNLRCIGWNELYKEGHRDARHAAAEIALEAEQEIERLRETLEKIAAPCYDLDCSGKRRDIARAARNNTEGK